MASPKPDNTLRALPRKHAELDGLDLHARLNVEDELSVSDQAGMHRTLQLLKDGIDLSIKNPSRLHGWRTQFLFEAVVASLGTVQLIKSEDAGAGFHSGPELTPPDYRIVTETGDKWLVEVKTQKPNGPKRPFTISSREVAKLRRYSDVTGSGELMLAVYWSAWNMWTVVPMDSLARESSSRFSLTLPDAMKANHFGLLGDSFIGTEYPLSLRFVDTSSDRNDPDTMTIEAVEARVKGRLVRKESETNIIARLLMASDWTDEQRVERDDAGNLTSVEFVATPSEAGSAGQQFRLHPPLSSLYSTLFNAVTLTDDGDVQRLRVKLSPGSMGRLVPDEYKGDVLKLWRFNQRPADEPDFDVGHA